MVNFGLIFLVRVFLIRSPSNSNTPDPFKTKSVHSWLKELGRDASSKLLKIIISSVFILFCIFVFCLIKIHLVLCFSLLFIGGILLDLSQWCIYFILDFCLLLMFYDQTNLGLLLFVLSLFYLWAYLLPIIVKLFVYLL